MEDSIVLMSSLVNKSHYYYYYYYYSNNEMYFLLNLPIRSTHYHSVQPYHIPGFHVLISNTLFGQHLNAPTSNSFLCCSIGVNRIIP